MSSPLKLKILLHYYVSNVDYDGTGPATEEAIEQFLANKLLRYNNPVPNVKYEITEKGIFYVKEILNIPYPVEMYVIPKEPNA